MSGARAGFGQDRAFAMLRAASCILCLWLASCSQARVSTAQAYAGPPLPPPNRIVVLDFATDPRNVSVDQGLRARITRELGDTSLTDYDPDAQESDTNDDADADAWLSLREERDAA